MTRCELAFVCDKQWLVLAPTAQEQVRHCSDCDQHVFRVDTDEEIEVARVLRRCSAIGLFPMSLGEQECYMRPMVPGLIALGVRLTAPVTDDRLVELRRSVPVVFDRGPVEARLYAGELIVLGEFEQETVQSLSADLERSAPELALAAPDDASAEKLETLFRRRYRWFTDLSAADTDPQ